VLLPAPPNNVTVPAPLKCCRAAAPTVDADADLIFDWLLRILLSGFPVSTACVLASALGHPYKKASPNRH